MLAMMLAEELIESKVKCLTTFVNVIGWQSTTAYTNFIPSTSLT